MSLLQKIIFLINPKEGSRKLVQKNFIWRSLGVFLNKIIKSLMIFFVARLLGPSEFGVYNFFIALVGAGFIFSDGGVNLILIRNFQQTEKKNHLVSSALFLKMSILVICCFASFGLLFFKSFSGPQLLGPLIILYFLLANLRDFFVNLFIAIQKTEFEFLAYFVESFVLIFLFLFYFLKNHDAVHFIFINLLAIFISMFVVGFCARLFVKISFKCVDFGVVKKLFFDGLPLSLFGLTSYIFFSTDQLFLKFYSGYAAVGFYSVASKIVLAFSIFPGLINSVLLPYMSKHIAAKEKIALVFKKILPLQLAIGFLITCVIFLLSPFLVPLFFGKEFVPAIRLTQALSFNVIFVFGVSILDYLLIAFNQQKQDFYFTFLAAILNLILNFIFVPMVGVYGVIIASLFSQAANFFITFWYAKKVFQEKYV